MEEVSNDTRYTRLTKGWNKDLNTLQEHNRDGATRDSTVTPWMDLAPEIWTHIFSFVPPRSVNALIRVCHLWHNIAMVEGHLWRTWFKTRWPHSRARPARPDRWKNLYLLKLKEERIAMGITEASIEKELRDPSSNTNNGKVWSPGENPLISPTGFLSINP
jgi:hypothetical protein